MAETKTPLTRRETLENLAPSTTQPFALLTTDQAAGILALSRRSVQEHVASGDLGCVKIGRAIRFTAADLQEFVDRNRRRARGWKESGKAQKGVSA